VENTATIPSLSRFARLGKAKVVALYNRMTPEGYVAELTPAWENFPTDDHVADTARMNRELQAAIMTMVPQYYWVHKRFKTRPMASHRCTPRNRRQSGSMPDGKALLPFQERPGVKKLGQGALHGLGPLMDHPVAAALEMLYLQLRHPLLQPMQQGGLQCQVAIPQRMRTGTGMCSISSGRLSSRMSCSSSALPPGRGGTSGLAA
jgi:hypothetical protein